MDQQELDTRFNRAVEVAANMTQAELPQDVQLRLYAFYKQATSTTPSTNYSTNADLRNAFKTNAWMQVRHISPDDAKEQYIDIINSLVKNRS